MRALQCFGGASRVRVSAQLVAMGPTRLRARYLLEGDTAALRLPPAVTAPQRRDELWRHSCLECFVAPQGSPRYVECNFSPAGDWAVYGFAAYRGQREDPADPRVIVGLRPSGAALELTAMVECAAFPWTSVALDCNLAAVLEFTDGRLEYHALSHPAAQPDFHDRRAFEPLAAVAGAP